MQYNAYTVCQHEKSYIFAHETGSIPTFLELPKFDTTSPLLG